MTDEELIIKAKLELDVKEANAKVEKVQKDLAEAIKNNAEKSTIDKLSKDLEKAQKEAKKVASEFAKMHDEGDNAVNGLGASFDSLGKKIAAVFSLRAATNFAIGVATTRSEFQQLEIAFTTLLKSEEKANALMDKAVQLAAKTPFDLQGVASGARQLIAYGFESERVIDDLRRLGDVAAGLGLPLQRLTYLYGTTRVQGRLYARDMLQFTNSGIPMLDTLAKMYGKTTQEINQMVSAGKIGFEDIEKAIHKMTDAGGQFANLMEKQSKSIGGQWSNIQDAIAVMKNEIGKSEEGLINGVLSTISAIVENYKRVIDVVITVAAAYGTYKATLFAVNAAQSMSTVLSKAHIKALWEQVTAQKALNASMMANPYAIVAGSVAGLITAFSRYQKAIREGGFAMKDFNKYVEEQDKKIQELESSHEDLIFAANNDTKSTEERLEAIKHLFQEYPQLLDKYGSEIEALGKISELKSDIAKLDKQAAYDADRAKYDAIGREIEGLEKSFESISNTPFFDMNTAISMKRISDRIEGLKVERKALADRMGDSKYADYFYDYPRLGGDDAEQKKKKQDYNYWSEQKKDLTEKYHQLEDVNSEEGKKLKKQIEDVNKELEKWSLSSPKNATSPAKAKAAASKEKTRDDEKQAEDKLKLEREVQQKLIDLKDEGYAKQLEQANLNHKKEMSEIAKQEKDKLKELQDLELKQWKAANPNKDESLFKPTLTELPEEWKTIFGSLRALEVQNYAKTLDDMAQEEKDRETDLYGTVADRRAKLLRDLNKSVDEASEEYKDAAIASRDAALLAFDISNDPNIKKAFGDVNKMSKKTINESIDLLRNRLKTLNPENPEDLQTIAQVQEQIKLLEEARDTNPFEYWGASLMDVGNVMNDIIKSQNRLNEAREKGDAKAVEAEEDLQKRLKEILKQMAIGYGMTTFVNGLQKASSLMKELADASGDVRLGEAAEKMGAFAQNLSAAAQGAAQGGWIGAIIGGASDMLNQTIEAFTTAKMEMIETKRNAEEFRHEMELAALAIDNTKFSNIFGSSVLDQMGEQWSKAQVALSAYNDRLNSISETYEDVKEYTNRSTGLGIFAPFIGAVGFNKKVTNEFKAMEDAVKKGYNGLQAMLIKTTDYSGWANFWGKQDKYTSLGDLAPELWDKDGDFNVANAKMFLQTNTQISEEQKNEIQNVIDLYEAYEKAMDSLKDTVASLMGDTLGGVADKMLDAFLNTGDAIADMSDLMGDFEKQMAKASIQALLMKNVFTSEAQDKMVELLAAGNTSEAVNFYNSLIEKANEYAPAINELLSSMNLENLDADARSAETKGFAQASQDSIDELNGRATAIQGMVYESNENTKVIKDNMGEIKNSVGTIMSQNERLLAYTSSMLDEVRGIHNDTNAMCDKLDDVVKSNDTINKNVAWIMDKGVKAL